MVQPPDKKMAMPTPEEIDLAQWNGREGPGYGDAADAKREEERLRTTKEVV